MTVVLGSAAGKIELDVSGVAAAVAKAKSHLGDLRSSWDDIAGKMVSTGAKMSLAVTTPLVGMAAKAIDAASDMNETVSKTQVVFGQAGNAVLKWGDNAAQAMGMSKQAALDAASAYGVLFTGAGFAEDAAAGMSTQIVELANDWASFANMDQGLVLEKFRAGLTGEYEPLKALGIMIDENTVKQKALQMGLAGTTKELTPQMLMLARLKLIFEQSGKAQGDFARTSGGLANSMRSMQAELAGATAAMGTALLPIALQLVRAITSLAQWFSNLSPAAQKVVVVIGGIAAAIGPVLMVIGTLMTAISGIGGAVGAIGGVLGGVGAAIAGALAPVLPIIAAIIAVVGLLYLAWKNNFLGIRDITAKVGGWLEKNVAKPVGDFFNKIGIGTKITQAWNTVTGKIKGVAEGAAAGVRSLTGAVNANNAAMAQMQDYGAMIGGIMGGSAALANMTALDSSFEDWMADIQAGAPAASEAWKNSMSEVASAVEGMVSSAQEHLKGLLPSDFMGGDITAPGANGPFENIYRAADVALRGSASEWAAKLGLTQEDAKKIVSDFQRGIFSAQVKGLIDMPMLVNEAKLQQAAQASKKAFVNEIAKQAGVAPTALDALMPGGGAEPKQVTALKTAATDITTAWKGEQKKLEPTLTSIQTTFTTTWTTITTKTTEWLDGMKALLTTKGGEINALILTQLMGIQTLVATKLAELLLAITMRLVELNGMVNGKLIELQAIISAALLVIVSIVQTQFTLLRDTAVGLANQMGDGVKKVFDELVKKAQEAGEAIPEEIAKGIRKNMDEAVKAAQELADAVNQYLPHSDAQKGPLSTLSAAGRSLPETLAAGIRAAQPALTAALAATLGAALPGSIGGRAAPAQQAAPAANWQTVNNVTINNPVGQTAKGDLIRGLRMLAYVGALSPTTG